MQNFFVYILKCSDGSYYVGHTDDLEVRMGTYAMKNCPSVGSYVRKRLPVELVFYDMAGTRVDAIQVERQLKGWSRKKKEALIQGGWEAVRGISKKNVD